MLATLNDVLKPAQAGRYAVGLFNTTDTDMLQAAMEAAEEARSPIIIGTAEVLLPYGELSLIAPALIAAATRATVPVVVHYDHGLTFEKTMEALKLGFTSVMFDASAKPYEENLAETAEVVKIAHAMGATVEGEIGHVGSAADGDDAKSDMYTTPEEAVAFQKATGVDALAVAIGTAHGVYKSKPNLNLSRLAEIRAALDTPLVLHGGSGLSDDDFRNTIAGGIAKVNIHTDMCIAGSKAMEASLASQSGRAYRTFDYLETRNSRVAAIKSVIAEKIRLFGSSMAKTALVALCMVTMSVTAANNPYGACAHVTRGEPTGRTCAMMRQAGMGWVRSDFDWRSIEKKKGVWDFTSFDKVLAESEAEGVQLLPILGYSVPWAHPAHAHLDAWEEYVRKVVTHYGKRLPVLEVWNEENIPGFWKDPNPTNYLAVLRRTYETAKKIEPNVRIAFGGTAGVPFKFIEEVYKLGGAKWFDIMNIHPYSHPRRPEGAMDAQIEKLRILMAQYGDAQKPIWITEVGWPTHSLRFSEGGLLLAGLKAARPELKAWRMLYVPARTDEEGGEADEAVRTQLLNVLPRGSRVEVCRSLDLAKRLAKGDVDGVVYPFTENYAADSVDAVYAFVKAGGVLVDFGGMPMWTACRADADGVMHPDKKAEPWKDRQRLRIAETAWWTDKRYPESMPVHPTAAAKGVKIPPKGFDGQRFLTPRLLQKGDAFIPLLSAPTNGIEAVAAAVYKFNSDMKGAIVVSGLFGRGSHGTSSNDRQAKMVARALGIAFAEGIENFFWYEFRQPDHDPYDPESYFGMVHDNFAPKPAYGAYMTFVDARPVGSVQKTATWRAADGTVYFPQWTRPDKRKAGMIWTTKAPHERKLTFTAPNVTFLDVSGARVRPERAGNVVTLTLSDSPIYFFGGELKDLP